MGLPSWLEKLKKKRVTDVLRRDPRSNSVGLLGIPAAEVFERVIGGGQADFDEPIDGLTGADRARFYAHYNQLGHLTELIVALTMLLKGFSTDDMIVMDVGCGPFTGGLAFAAVCGPTCRFTYFGVDRSVAMRELGEEFANEATVLGGMHDSPRHWVGSLTEVRPAATPGWRPVLVVVSYLLASPTVDPIALVEELDAALVRLGRGPVAVLYTNSPKDWPNRSFPAFQAELEKRGFVSAANASGQVAVVTAAGTKDRTLRYALFHRPEQNRLILGGR